MSQMVTVCPNCRQQLAVTPDDLRVGQGFVRCGRCDKVFNALLTLAADTPAPPEPESVAHGTVSMPALDEQDVLPPLPGEEDAIPFGSLDEEVEVVQTHVTGQYRSLVLEGDRARENDDNDAREELAREIIRQATSQPIDLLLDEIAPESPAPAGASPPAASHQATVPRQPAESASDETFDADEAFGNAPRQHRLWYVAAGLLALLLLGQYLHHNRQQLVTRGWLAAPVQEFYGLFGQNVEPPWDLSRYEVTELGGMSLSGDARTLVLRAAVSVTAESRWSQPAPLIRAVLSDRWGNRLATHEFAPQEWLLGGAPERLKPGERLDAELSMPAPERVNSFELEACLRDTGGVLRCKDDPAT